MRDKLALTIALAGFAVTTAFGVGIAGASGSAGLGASQAADPLSTAPLAPAAPALACANEADDDGDGLVDLADPDCESSADPEEASAAPPAEEEDSAEEAPRTAPVDGVRAGAVLDADNATTGSGGVTRNQGIGDSGVASPVGAGAVTAPPATAGDQPAEQDDGGLRFSDGGTPNGADPTTTIAPFGPAPIGVPNIVIDSFEIPPFLLPIYQACGTEYGVPWQVLASINKIETAFGTNLNVSSAGAMGWMQFIPSSWEAYGVDANGDGRKDPYNPIDAICAAANYLKAAGAHEVLYSAIFADNHADWYVQEV
ncbi:MAG TPA: lytic transglycosylase domain-containing protein, partial [Solirubrobacterales bacterium]|nr:lytic transglycosylase domain-containing protein [Solirubrobacterales bacterium]